jgi:hypothetical protein
VFFYTFLSVAEKRCRQHYQQQRKQQRHSHETQKEFHGAGVFHSEIGSAAGLAAGGVCGDSSSASSPAMISSSASSNNNKQPQRKQPISL